MIRASWGLALMLAGPTCADSLPDRLTGHGGPIRAISIAADGSRALTASFDYAVILWALEGAEARISQRMRGHAAAVNDAGFVPGANRAVSVGDDGAMALWDLGQGTALWIGSPDGYKALDLDIAPDGQVAAMAKWDGSARVIGLAEGRELARLPHRAHVNAVAFSADGATLYTGAQNGEILAWDWRAEQPLRPLHDQGWGVNALARLPDGRLAFGALDGTFALLEIESGTVTRLAASDRPIQSVKLSQDGALLAYGDGAGQIGVFTLSGAPVETGLVTYGPVWDFDFLPGTAQIYHVGLDDFAARWRIAPRDFGPIQAELPRRFQIRDSADPGELEFLRKCSVCHTLTPEDGGRAGPTLYGLFGRPAAALPDYPYSDALKALDVIWDEATVAQLFDDGPDVMVPGTKMPIQRLKSVARREELIAFLKRATAPVE